MRRVIEEPQEHEHTYAPGWTSDETGHWHAATCEHTSEKGSFAAHTDADKDGKCDVCGYVIEEPHEHTYSDKFTAKDETGHWRLPTCDDTTDGIDFAAHVDADKDGKCDVCGYQMEAVPPAHEHTYAQEWTTSNTQHWHAATCEHTNEKGSLGDHVDENNDDECDVCGFEMYESVTTYADFAAGLEIAGGSGSGFKLASDLTIGKFTFEKGSYFEEGLVNNQQKKITFTLSGKDNSVKFDMKGASGSGMTMSLYKVGTDGDTLVKTWELVPSGTTVSDNEVTGLAVGTYYLVSVGSARVSNLSVTEYVEKSDVTGITVSGAVNEFLAGREFASDGLNVTLNYENGRADAVTSGYYVDFSEVDMETEGEYTVTVKYGEMEAKYKVKVFAIKSITLEMYDLNSSRVTQNVQEIFIGGSQFSSANLGVVALAECGSEQKTFVLEASEYSCGQPSLTVAGYATVTVSALDVPSATAEYEVAVVSAKLAAAEEYTITVDPSAQLSVDGASATVHTINQALQLITLSDVSDSAVKTIKIKPGSYKEKVEVNIPNVHMIGDLTGDATNKDVVIWYDALAMDVSHGGVTHSTDGSATVSVRSTASGFYAKDLTFKNYYNTNELYEESKKLGNDTQAVALLADCDMCVFENVYFTSYHDTLYAMRGRQVYTGCEIEGRTDYIFGYNATAYFYDCTIRTLGANDEKNGGYIVATKGFSSGHTSDAIEYGYIFDNCDLIADENVVDGTVSIARGWAEDMRIMVMNSTISKAYSKEAYGYTDSNKNDRYTKMNAEPVAAQLLEYNNTGDGAITESIADTCTVITDASVAEKYADFSVIFAATNGLQKYDCDWAGSVQQVTVEICSGEVKVGQVTKYKGQSVTAEEVELGVTLGEGLAIDKIYTDAELTQEFDFTTAISADTTLYVTTKLTDPTIRENVSYTFGNSDYEELTAAGSSKLIGLMLISAGESGSFIKHNSKYYKLTGDASITLEVTAGSILNFVTYDNELALTLNGKDVTANGAYNQTSGDCTYTYAAAEDGTLVLALAEGKSQLYLTSLQVIVPYSESTSIDIGNCTTTYNGNIGYYGSVKIDATNGKLRPNGGSVQVNPGTVLTVYTAPGATVSLTWYSDAEVQYGADANAVINYNEDKTVATITFRNDPDGLVGTGGIYIRAINVSVVAEEKGVEFTADNCGVEENAKLPATDNEYFSLENTSNSHALVTLAAEGGGTVAETIDGSDRTFIKAFLPGGNSKTLTLTAKKDITITVYYTASNSGFNTTDQTKSGSLTWLINGGIVNTDTNTDNKDGRIAYAVTINLSAGDVCVLGTDSNRFVLFGIYAV